MTLIYKLLTPEPWETFKTDKRFLGSPIDLADGFIHFSAADQVRETAAKHFAEHDRLVLLAVNASELGDRLRWEESRGGVLFPHLYDILELDAVNQTWHLRRSASTGVHDFSSVDLDSAD